LDFERSWNSRQDSEGYKTLKDSDYEDYEDLDYKAMKLLEVSDSEGHVSIKRLSSVLSSFE